MEQNGNAMAGEGLKKIFLSQVLGIIGAVCALIVAAAAVFTLGGVMAGSGGATLGGAGVTLILGLATLILLLVGFIFYLIGLNKASCAHEGFKNAIMLVVAQIVLSVISSFIRNATLSGVIGIASTVIAFLVVYHVCMASAELLRGVGDEVTAAKGDSVRNIYMVCMIIDVVCGILGLISALAGLAGLIHGVSALVQLVAMFIYMSYLKRAGDVLIAS